MNTTQIVCFILLSVFYISYILKMFLLKRQGINGNVLGKGEKPTKKKYTELFLRAVTLAGAVIQYASVFFDDAGKIFPVNRTVQAIGILLIVFGNLFFIAAILIMKNNWRAGFDHGQHTNLVTDGVYQISRNPAFVGFDFLYIGCALIVPNILNVAVTLFAILLFHMQILGEEGYLADVFGQEYMQYKARVSRYL